MIIHGNQIQSASTQIETLKTWHNLGNVNRYIVFNIVFSLLSMYLTKRKC